MPDQQRRRAATRKHKITRGPRKGQVITVYVSNGREVRNDVATGKRGTNRQKGNPRANQKYDEAIDSKGREVHIYTDPKTGKQKRVTLKGKRHDAVKGTKAKKYEDGSSGLTITQRQAAVRKRKSSTKRKGAVQKRSKK